MSKQDSESSWQAVLAGAVKAQQLIPGATACGGTAAALYAGHRISLDADQLLPNLRDRFDIVLQTLQESPDWKTARTDRPVLILGSLAGAQVGFRQQRRSAPLETQTIATLQGPLIVPTLDEMIGMKAFLAYDRNATRDYLDFVALASCTAESAVLASLLKTDVRYGSLQTASVSLEVAKALTDPQPYDLDETNLSTYKSLIPEWHSWDHVRTVCSHFGQKFGEELLRLDS
jgi:hypothetical protein